MYIPVVPNLDVISRVSLRVNSLLKVRVSVVEDCDAIEKTHFIDHLKKYSSVIDEINGITINPRENLKTNLSCLNETLTSGDVLRSIDCGNQLSLESVDFIDNTIKSFNSLSMVRPNKDKVVNMFADLTSYISNKDDNVKIVSSKLNSQDLLDHFTMMLDFSDINSLCELISYSNFNNDIMLVLFTKPVMLVLGIKTFSIVYKSYCKDFVVGKMLEQIKKRYVYMNNIYYSRFITARRIVIGTIGVSTFIGSLALFFKTKPDNLIDPRLIKSLSDIQNQCLPSGVAKEILDVTVGTVSKVSYSLFSVMKAVSTGAYYVIFQPAVDIILDKNKK